MDGKHAALLAMLALGLVGAATGCKQRGDDVACKAFCERMEKCIRPSPGKGADALSKQRASAARAAFERVFGNQAGCVKGCRRHHGKKRSDMMKKCLAASGCRAFFDCVGSETNASGKTGSAGATRAQAPGTAGAQAAGTTGAQAPPSRAGSESGASLARSVHAQGTPARQAEVQGGTEPENRAYATPTARCKRLCEMRKRCAGAFVEKLWKEKNLPPQLREQMKKELVGHTADVATCMTQCLGGQYRTDDTGKCLQTNDCQTFLRCFQDKKKSAQGRARHANVHAGRKAKARPRTTAHSGGLCGRLCRRMSRCADAFALLIGRGLEDRQKAILKRKLRQHFGNVGRCLADCRRTKTRQDEATARRCLAAPGCRGFARCVIAAGGKAQ